MKFALSIDRTSLSGCDSRAGMNNLPLREQTTVAYRDGANEIGLHFEGRKRATGRQ